MNWINTFQKTNWIAVVICLILLHCVTYGQSIESSLNSTINTESLELTPDVTLETDVELKSTLLDVELNLDDSDLEQNDTMTDLLEVLESLNIDTNIVTRNIVPEEDLVGDEDFIEQQEQPIKTVESRDENKPFVAQPEGETPEVDTPEQKQSTTTLRDVIEKTVQHELAKKEQPKQQPWLEFGLDYYQLNFATNKRFDPFAAIHGIGGLSMNVKGVELFYGFNNIDQNYVENSIYYTFESIHLNYSAIGVSYQRYINQTFSIHGGFIQATASGTYMGERLKEAVQSSIFIGCNVDIYESITLRVLFVPYLKSTFKLDNLENSFITYDFIHDTKVTTTETFNNVMVGLTWALPFWRL